ncbi:hypothetical protein ACW7EJ_10935, partial [Acinetobacter soli]
MEPYVCLTLTRRDGGFINERVFEMTLYAHFIPNPVSPRQRQTEVRLHRLELNSSHVTGRITFDDVMLDSLLVAYYIPVFKSFLAGDVRKVEFEPMEPYV